MKKGIDFIMANRYALIAFAVLVFGLKLLLGYYHLPESYLPWFNTLETIFITVFIAAFIHFFSVFVIAWVTKGKSAHWWELRDGVGEKLLNYYTKGLLFSIPVIMYGTLLYFALFASWKNIVGYAAIFIIVRFINYWQTNRKQRLQREM